ncbi:MULTISPECIES: DUF1643 domain-containing protein [Lysinibacillus]|uniref:DUF1643 domain-containing protein n=1 Tax=Lysinibacillus fusiformis TaxID=28031 RepID=A0A1E4QZV6_9BACI|nr:MULTISPECIES: DUF1643 domain-containing protein [Lysinibacillus]ODV53736.1 hypothetical protein BG258_20360 [Lysinibacillus fusiformis]
MKVFKSTLKTEIVFDDALANKYIVRKEWNKSKKAALVIMKSAGETNEVEQDHTTMYVTNNLARLDYGSVIIMNLFPTIIGANSNESAVENLKYLQEEMTKVDDVIIAVGTGIESNKLAVSRLKMMVAILLDKKANLLELECPRGRRGFHPLYPAVKNEWNLVPYEYVEMSV